MVDSSQLTNLKGIWRLIYIRIPCQFRVLKYHMIIKRQKFINAIRMIEEIFMMSQIKKMTFLRMQVNSITFITALTTYRAWNTMELNKQVHIVLAKSMSRVVKIKLTARIVKKLMIISKTMYSF